MRIEKREEFISAIAADRKMAKTLDTDPGSPILRIEVKLTSFSGDVAEYRLSHCKLGGMKFHVSWDNV